VENAITGRVAARSTTPAKARQQLRLLHDIDQRAGRKLCSCPCFCWQDSTEGTCDECLAGRHATTTEIQEEEQ
jgi:5'-3' exonuclease